MNMRIERGFPGCCGSVIRQRQLNAAWSPYGRLRKCCFTEDFSVRQIARRDNLFPLIAGDLFHRATENNLRLLNRLAMVLRQFPVRPLTLEGNHDKSQVSCFRSRRAFLAGCGQPPSRC